MSLYDEKVTTLSLKTLRTIADMIDVPLCLCGGWAVYFTVNEFFKQKKNREYIGSQDIDLGFSLPSMMTKKQLEDTTLFKTLEALESLGFESEGFRYKKQIQINAKKEDTDTIADDVFVLYVDVLVNSYPPSLYDLHPNFFIQVPLIEKAYQKKKNQVQLSMISERLFMPSRPILTAMKIQSFPNRGISHHKKIKDLCDIYSLLWFSDSSIHENMNNVCSVIHSSSLKKVKEEIDTGLISECEQYLGEPRGSIATTLQIIDTFL